MRPILAAAAAALVLAAAPGLPARAQPAPLGDVNQASPEAFVDSLARITFGTLRETGRSEAERDARFREMIRTHFAIRTIGDRLIRRQRGQISAAQYDSYVAALPDFIVGTYADRLAQYEDATFKVVRSVPRGTRGEADVVSSVSRPGQRPFQAVWSLVKDSAGRYRIANLTVDGVNVALSQEADFAAYIERNGFDGLIAFMRSRAKGA